jgi:hypothetical protein
MVSIRRCAPRTQWQEEHQKEDERYSVVVHAGAFGEPEIRVGETGDSSNFPMEAQASLRRNSGLELAYQ